MSNIVNKVKDAVTGHPGDATTTTTDTHLTGAHGTRSTSHPDTSTGRAAGRIARVDLDRDYRGNTVGGTGPGGMGSTHTASSTNYGPRDSNGANKIDPRGDTDPGAIGSVSHGPHGSSAMNKLDPRADPDLDEHGGLEFTGIHGAHGTTGIGSTGTDAGTGYGTSASVGPHGSNMMNKLDPRIDPDFDGCAGLGSATRGTHGTAGVGSTTLGTPGAAGIGSTGTHTGTSYGTSASRGPHGSHVMDGLDPHVDSGHDGRTGFGSTTHGTHGTTGIGSAAYGTSGTTGVSTGTHGTIPDGAPHTATYTGSAPNTAGPHKSDLMNKLEPRVDFDLDGSKTLGADRTYAAGSGTGVSRGTHQLSKDPYDAMQVPPS
ncbi:hypothetical protein C7212DRAFT_359327 [Tuber magnatum]|uniref:Cell surface protein n=1 Tax=Tuber magnatum TaxID=42249 RepID=A0A317SKF0_9PEZI|nr:hypothetical protein C7212DRAFT_359327 [Tuber magnatum]